MTSTTFQGLDKLIHDSYDRALESKDLHFTESEVINSEESGIQLEIRYAPALAKKPGRIEEKKTPSADPFAPPYNPNLYVTESQKPQKGDEDNDGDDEDEYVILLNKFCVVPRHFLIVTKEFRPQNSPLTPNDLFTAYSVLSNIAKNRKEPEHLIFYNCGPQSGASQPHKHLQCIPLPNDRTPLTDLIEAYAPENEDEVFFLPALPFANFFMTIPKRLNSKSHSKEIKRVLVIRYMKLIDSMIDHARHSTTFPHTMSQMSYNFIMSTTYMQLVPRIKEKFVTTPTQDGQETQVSVNSLGFSGMLLVKSDQELNTVKSVGVLEILKAVAFPLLDSQSTPDQQEI